jgi:dolichol-phosphate mannosyltransferase
MLAELLTGTDVVVGSRHVDGGSTGEWSRLRRLQSWIATKTAQFLLGIKLKDPMSGYFLVWRKDFVEVKGQLDGKGFKILLEILARLHASRVKEVPYTFRSRTHGESKLSSKIALQYVQQLWRLCSASPRLSVRFLKSAVVGGVGVFVNLAVMAFLLRLTKVQGWQASAVASLIANLHNYTIINLKTHADRFGKKVRKPEGYLSYLLVSAASLAVTTGSYAGLVWGLARASLLQGNSAAHISLIRLTCQFVAVLLGVGFNYALNKLFTRRVPPPQLDPPETCSGSSLVECTKGQHYKNVPNLAPGAGK